MDLVCGGPAQSQVLGGNPRELLRQRDVLILHDFALTYMNSAPEICLPATANRTPGGNVVRFLDVFSRV
ncbi:hypothetical protein AB0N05_11330 [Nocardia sp. NPDC051030]|uniref:hypothetical protein n=1 Tax=Nocardia sp. NPDC051030 TaxID=3155162 RepID=UPI0034472F29